MSTDIQLLVGLGNPGPDYATTRHNVGFWFAEEVAARYGGAFASERKFQAELARCRVGDADLRLLKPMTYMNRSGSSVRAVLDFFKLTPEQVLVVHDDLDLPPGRVKLKWSGGHGGHNGLRDLIRHLGRDFRRMRLGIGHPGESRDVVAYVLKRASAADENAIREGIAEAADALPVILSEGLEAGMNRLHQRD